MLEVFLLLDCFFFKQKTAYEMRISDWSSDVCSSDLAARWRCGLDRTAKGARRFRAAKRGCAYRAGRARRNRHRVHSDQLRHCRRYRQSADRGKQDRCWWRWRWRAEERRAGKEWVSTCSSRWVQEHKKKHKDEI